MLCFVRIPNEFQIWQRLNLIIMIITFILYWAIVMLAKYITICPAHCEDNSKGDVGTCYQGITPHKEKPTLKCKFVARPLVGWVVRKSPSDCWWQMDCLPFNSRQLSHKHLLQWKQIMKQSESFEITGNKDFNII